MELYIVLECKILREIPLVGMDNQIKWLKPEMRMRLTIDNENYKGFPIVIKKVNYLDEGYIKVVVDIILITDSEYANMNFFLENKDSNLATGTTFLGKCRIIECREYGDKE